MRSKGNSTEPLLHQAGSVKRQAGFMVKKIELDCRRKYKKGLKGFEGLVIEVCPTGLYRLQKNRKVEQMDHLVKNDVRTMLITASPPKSVWAQLLYAICDVRRRVVLPWRKNTRKELLAGVEARCPAFLNL